MSDLNRNVNNSLSRDNPLLSKHIPVPADELQHSTSQPSLPHYPPHFLKGSVIQLANGDMKHIEELTTEDFVNSADISGNLKIDLSTVIEMKLDSRRGTVLLSFSVGPHTIPVSVESTLEHPFFVFQQGWSSYSPDKTLLRYRLSCHQLKVGDKCISLTQKDFYQPAPNTYFEKHDQIMQNDNLHIARIPMQQDDRAGSSRYPFTGDDRVPQRSRLVSDSAALLKFS